MNNYRPGAKVAVLAALCTLALSACQAAGADTSGGDGQPSVQSGLCSGPTSNQYMGCSNYQPPVNLQNEWNNGGWDAGAS
jgi:hypothetical protein